MTILGTHFALTQCLQRLSQGRGDVKRKARPLVVAWFINQAGMARGLSPAQIQEAKVEEVRRLLNDDMFTFYVSLVFIIMSCRLF